MVGYKVFVITAFLSVCTSALEIGSICIHEKSGRQGKCKLISDCPEAVSQLQTDQVIPQSCGSFVGTLPVVCCDGNSSTTLDVTTTTSHRPHSIIKQKCQEYGSWVYEIVQSIALIPTPNTTLNISKCGIGLSFLPGYNSVANRNEFPHMALIGFDGRTAIEWQCSGALISEQFVLLAAHCVLSRALGAAKYVRVGVLHSKSTEHAQTFEIIEAFKHPDFKPPSQYNDIALIKLNQSAIFNSYVRPACLSEETNFTDTQRAIATGWNNLDFDSNDRMYKTKLNYFSFEVCNKTYAAVGSGRKLKFEINPKSQICFESNSGEKDSCQYDSGGPLQIYNKDVFCMYNIIGVTSLGKTCGSHLPGVYTKVSNYIKWIENIVWP